MSALLTAAALVFTAASSPVAFNPTHAPDPVLWPAPAAFQVAQASARPAASTRNAARPATLDARRAQRAKQLRWKYKLQPNQEAALQAYVVATVRPKAAPSSPPDPRWTPLQRLDHEGAQLAAKTAAHQRRADATRRFYAALTPTQRAIFNAPPAKTKPGAKARS